MHRHRWLLLAGAMSVASALAAHRLVDRLGTGSVALRLLVALAPIPFFLLFIVAEFRWIRAQDEYHRKVVLDSLAIAFPLVIAEAVTAEALQSAGWFVGLTIGDIWPFMALTWVPSLWIAARRYR